MVNVNGRLLDIPLNDKNIGFSGDNKVEIRIFEITEIALFGFEFKLDVKTSNGAVGIVDLVKTVEVDKVVLAWEILQEHITQKGLLYAQIRAFSNNNEVWHSEIGYFNVGNSINATDYFPSPLPSEFEQMEARVTAAKNEVEADRAEVALNTATVAENTQTVNEKTIIVVEKSAEVAEDTAEVAGNTEIAETSANTAAQALSDLLAMLGSDIATLTGGKLTPSQIPAIAITNTYPVANEAEMLALDCQTGDVCIRLDESKSYILQGTNPALLSEWQHLKTPTNYADTAGHALTADEATNASKINGHSLVRFNSIAEMESAVKIDGTLYYAPYNEV